MKFFATIIDKGKLPRRKGLTAPGGPGPSGAGFLAAAIIAVSAGQVAAQVVAKPDTSAVQKADTTEINRFIFKSKSKIEYTETYRQAETGFNATYTAANGWNYGSNINVGKKSFRGRDMDVILETMMNTAARIRPNLYTLTIMIGNTYNKQKSLGLARYGKEIVLERESAAANFSFNRPVAGATKSLYFLNTEGSRGEQDFKYNKTFRVEAGGHANYQLVDGVKVSAGFGSNIQRENSQISYINFSGIPSYSDTISTKLELGRGDRKLLRINYSRKMGTIRQVAPPLGNSLEVLDDPEAAQEETNKVMGDIFVLESKADITDKLKMDVSFKRNYSDDEFKIENRRNKESESKELEATISYKYHPRGSLGLNLAREESDTELGPTSVASYRRKEYSINATLSQTIHDSLQVTLSASTSLDQKFYKKKEQNPRDADYLYSTLTGQVQGYLFRSIKTKINFRTTRHETVNIDATLSGDNRVDFQYYLSPEISFKPSSWSEIRQKYEIRLDYTEFTFDPDKNYLDRNTVLVTDASFKILEPVKFSISHRYQMKDTGSYLPADEGEKLYAPSNENLENRLRMNFEYRPEPEMLFFIYTSFRTQESNSLGIINGRRGIVSSTGSDSGDMKLGFERSRPVTEYGKLDLDVAYVKKFSPFLSEDRRQYWEVNMNLEIDF